MMSDTPMVFLSHANADAQLAEQLAEALKAADVDVWLYVSHPEGGDFVEAISHALNDRQVLLLLLTPDSLASRWVTLEMNAAIVRYQQGLMLAPVIVKMPDVSPASIPAMWAPYNRIDIAEGNLDVMLPKVLRALQATTRDQATGEPRQPISSGPGWQASQPRVTTPPAITNDLAIMDAPTLPLRRTSRMRKVILIASLVLVLLGVSGAVAGKLIHDRLYPSPTQSVILKWKFSAGGSAATLDSQAGSLYVGSTDDNLYVINEATGAQVSKTTFDGPLAQAPNFNGSMIYILSTTGRLYAINATTGAQIWQQSTAADGVHGYTIVDGVIYLPTPSGLYLMDAATGKQLWKDRGLGDVGDVAVNNGLIYVTSGNSFVYAFDALTRTLRWEFQTGDSVTSGPAINGSNLYVVSADHYLYALDATTGSLHWRHQLGGSVTHRPLIVAGVIYLGCTDHNVYAIDAATGNQRWSFQTDGKVSYPSLHAGVLYVGSTDHKVYALDAATGALRWSYTTSGAVGRPLVANGTVYVGSTDGNVYAITY